MSRTILMTGATGLLGRQVASALQQRGDRLIVLSRHPDRARGVFPHAAQCLLWAPGVDGAWIDAVGGADAVLHLAGESIGARRWSPAVKRAILDSRVRGTQDLVRAIGRARNAPPVLISASGVGYYGDTGDRAAHESDQPGADFLADVCAAWEGAAFDASQYGCRVVALRTAVVLARDGGALPLLARPFRLYAGGPVGSGSQWFPWVHVTDYTAAVLHALDNATLRGGVNVVAPDLPRNRDFCAALAAALHRPSWFRVPAPLLRLAVGEFADTLVGGQRCAPDALHASGFRFHFGDLRAALADLFPNG